MPEQEKMRSTAETAVRFLHNPDHQFALNIPEHLPSSPLCPKNPKHKSGGKGTCVYHGKRKSKSMIRKQIPTGDSEDEEPLYSNWDTDTGESTRGTSSRRAPYDSKGKEKAGFD